MAIQPLVQKRPSLWRKPTNVIALLGVLTALVALFIQTGFTIDANNRVDSVNEQNRLLEEQLNTLLNSSLAQANSISNQSLALTQQALELERISSDYEPSIIPYAVNGDFGFYNYSGQSLSMLEGNITVSLIVISPHACIINFTDLIANHNKMFLAVNELHNIGNGTVLPILDQEQYTKNSLIFDNMNYTGDFFKHPSGRNVQKYVQFVPAGVNQVNFTFELTGFFTFNREFFKATGRTDVFPEYVHLAEMNFDAKILDVQRNKEYTKPLGGSVIVWLIAVPPHSGWS